MYIHDTSLVASMLVSECSQMPNSPRTLNQREAHGLARLQRVFLSNFLGFEKQDAKIETSLELAAELWEKIQMKGKSVKIGLLVYLVFIKGRYDSSLDERWLGDA